MSICIINIFIYINIYIYTYMYICLYTYLARRRLDVVGVELELAEVVQVPHRRGQDRDVVVVQREPLEPRQREHFLRNVLCVCERVCLRESERESVCVRVCERERERERVCVCVRERQSVCVRGVGRGQAPMMGGRRALHGGRGPGCRWKHFLWREWHCARRRHRLTRNAAEAPQIRCESEIEEAPVCSLALPQTS